MNNSKIKGKKIWFINLKLNSSWSYISINEGNLLGFLVSVNWSNLGLVKLSVISFTTFRISTLLLFIPDSTTNSDSKNKDNSNYNDGSITSTRFKRIIESFFWLIKGFKCCILLVSWCILPSFIIILPFLQGSISFISAGFIKTVIGKSIVI